jgi:outer membrane protein assembly factor BamB
MVVLDAATGKTLWQKWTGTETPNQPAIAGDLVIAPHPDGDRFGEGGTGFALSAYRKRDGDEVWSSGIDNHGLEAPIVHGDSVYISTMSGTLYRIGLDGKRRWKRDVGAASAPWIAGDTVHLAIKDGAKEAQVVLAADDGRTLRTVSSTRAPGDMAYDDTSVWSYEGARPVVQGGVRYVATAGAVEARDATSGDLIWERHQDKRGIRSLNQVIVVGSLVLVASRDGKVIALDRETGVQKLGFDFDAPIASQPIVADGWMYVTTTRGQILGFELGNPSTYDGWHMWGGNALHNL